MVGLLAGTILILEITSQILLSLHTLVLHDYMSPTAAELLSTASSHLALRLSLQKTNVHGTKH